MGGLPFTNNLYIRSRPDNQREIQLLVYHWGRPWCNIMFLLFLLRPRLQLLPLVGIFASTRENYLIYDSNTTALQYTVDPAANVKCHGPIRKLFVSVDLFSFQWDRIKCQ